MESTKRTKDFALIKYLADYRFKKIGGSDDGLVIQNDKKSKAIIFTLPFGDALVGLTVDFENDLSKTIDFDLSEVHEKYGKKKGDIDAFIDGFIAFLKSSHFRKNVMQLSSGRDVSLKETITRPTDEKSDAMAEIVRVLDRLKEFTGPDDLTLALTDELLRNEWYVDYDWHHSLACLRKAAGLGLLGVVGLVLMFAVHVVFALVAIPALGGAGFFGFVGGKKYAQLRKNQPTKKGE